MTDKDMQAFEQQCPEKIYLLDMGEDMPVWCDDASPDYDDRFSVEYIRADVASAESAKEIKQLEADIGGLKDLLKLERDKNTRILRESDAEIERLKKQISALKECPPRKWTDEEGREWHLLDFGYGTPSDIRLTLRLGTAFSTAEYSIANTKKEG